MARTLLMGLAAAAIPLVSAAAAPATPEEAARLTALFERYVSHPAAGQPSGVTVAPEGESYVATVDLKRAAAGLGLDAGASVDAAVGAPASPLTLWHHLVGGGTGGAVTTVDEVALEAALTALDGRTAVAAVEGGVDFTGDEPVAVDPGSTQLTRMLSLRSSCIMASLNAVTAALVAQ